MSRCHFTFEEFATPAGQKLLITDPGEWVLYPGFKRDLPRIYNMEVRPDDVWLLGLPKSGNTWASEMIWNVLNDADTEKAKNVDHFKRWLFPEYECYAELVKEAKAMNLKVDPFKEAVEAPSPRLIRSHLPLSCLPPNLLNTAKVVYIYRDQRDCAVSQYHMIKDIPDLKVPLQFGGIAASYCSDIIQFSPRLKHLREAWEVKDHPNMFFIAYEEMKKDLPAVLKKIAKFFNKTLTEEQILKLQDHLSIESMRENKSINMKALSQITGQKAEFMRKGVVGDHKNYFTSDIQEMWDAWLEKHLSGTTLKFE